MNSVLFQGRRLTGLSTVQYVILYAHLFLLIGKEYFAESQRKILVAIAIAVSKKRSILGIYRFFNPLRASLSVADQNHL